MNRLRKDTFNKFHSIAKNQKARGLYNGCRPILLKDIKHMIHCMNNQAIEAGNKFFDVKALQSLVAIMFATTTGRRFLEVMSLSLQSLHMEVIDAKLQDGTFTELRILRYAFCKSKGKGTATYYDKLCAKDNTPVEENTMLFLLLLLQYRGIMASEATNDKE